MRLILLSAILFSLNTRASLSTIEEEFLYDFYTESINKNNYQDLKNLGSLNQDYQKLYIDALWDQWKEGKLSLESTDLQLAIKDPLISFEERSRLLMIYSELSSSSSHKINELFEQSYEELLLSRTTHKLLYLYLNSSNINSQSYSGFTKIKNFYTNNYSAEFSTYYKIKNSFRPKTKKEIQDLVFFNHQVESYRDTVSLYMFCRHSRKQKCMMIMKDNKGELVFNEDNELWHQVSLGLARNGVSFDQRKGYTPSGVYTMDSVMPEANKQKFYGKFRRIILNFIEKSSFETKLKSFLPKSAKSKNWWKESVIARDVGRNLLRIHGTGLISPENEAFFPLVETSGCISKREGHYNGVEYKDQRLLLDKLMDSLGLEMKYENEEKVSGVLYVVELDNKKKAVELAEIKNYLDIN